MEPVFLRLDEVIEIHRDQLERYGGSQGIRDIGLLESALAMPTAYFGGQYLHNDIFEMAAAYLYHIVQDHPFIDGNKRTGTVAAIVFLAMNDIELEADENKLEALVRAIAEGKMKKAEIAKFLRTNYER